jgi:hypothetical protein
MARALGGGKYRPRVVPREGVYKRRAKHVKRVTVDAD